jgi:hypothetical protein
MGDSFASASVQGSDEDVRELLVVDSFASASVPGWDEDVGELSVVEHPIPLKIYKDPQNMWGFDTRVVNSYAPTSDSRMSANQVLYLFSNLFPLFPSDFVRFASSVKLRNASPDTPTPMIDRAPLYTIVYGLGRFGFNMEEVPANAVLSQLEYCAWLLLACVQPHSKEPRNSSRKNANVQHVLCSPSSDGTEELHLWTHILVLPTSSIFFTRFANTGQACTPQLHIPLPTEWLRLRELDSQVAEDSFIESYTVRYKIYPNVPLGTPTAILATHHPDFSVGTPFVAPDYYLPLSPEDSAKDLRGQDLGLRQKVYRSHLQVAPSARSLCRRYIQGALFHNPASTGGVFKITTSMLALGTFDLHVDVLQDGRKHPLTQTCIRVARCWDADLLAAGRTLAGTIPSSTSGVRRESHQHGVMHSFGKHVYNGVVRKFKENPRQATALKQFTKLFGRYLSLKFPLEAAAMTTSERSRGLYPDTSSFSEDSPCASLNASVDLGNSDHYDTRDISIGVSLFLTDDPTCTVSDWFFVLPNIELEFKGECYKGVLIELQDGVALSWDGRQIRHCTSTGVTTGLGNRRYGLHMAANGPTVKLSSPGNATL